MGMMFGFAGHRRKQLNAELARIVEELARLGVERAYLVGDLADGDVKPASDLELVLVHRTAEPVQRRADFFTTHLRPRVGTRFHVYTPEEFDPYGTAADCDDVVLRAVRESGVGLFG